MSPAIIDPVATLAEFLGTMIYAYGYSCSKGEPYAIAGCMYIAMALTGYVSTPQFNPAVTLAMMLRRIVNKEFKIKDVFQSLANFLAQIVGALLGALLSWATTHHVYCFYVQDKYDNTQGFFGEMIYTAVICATCLTIKKVTESLLLSGVAISAAYLTASLSVRKITRGCFNPAVGLGLNLIHYAKDGTHYSDTWIFVIAPFLGSVVGAGVAIVFLGSQDEELDPLRTKSLEGRIAT